MLTLTNFVDFKSRRSSLYLTKPQRFSSTEMVIIMSGWISNFMNHPATYLKAGWVQISVSNLIVILLMLTVFALAIFIPFPNEDSGKGKK